MRLSPSFCSCIRCVSHVSSLFFYSDFGWLNSFTHWSCGVLVYMCPRDWTRACSEYRMLSHEVRPFVFLSYLFKPPSAIVFSFVVYCSGLFEEHARPHFFWVYIVPYSGFLRRVVSYQAYRLFICYFFFLALTCSSLLFAAISMSSNLFSMFLNCSGGRSLDLWCHFLRVQCWISAQKRCISIVSIYSCGIGSLLSSVCVFVGLVFYAVSFAK